ncbi:MAG: hypothetical protein LBS63_04595, partial [Prevotellaceae bacterium]|nr:hypothetical protein [Prevotellaceae bacterium]
MRILFIGTLLVALAASCLQREFAPDSTATLRFSSDTINFDTVFAPLGSTTFSCRVYNPGSANLRFDAVQLAGGAASPFRMNVDGQAGYRVGGVKLAGRDSLFIFIEVQKNRELLLTDAIEFIANGAALSSRLEVVAYGQAVALLDGDSTLRGACTFTADRPYLVNGTLTVDSSATLNVEAGARLYFSAKAGLTVDGALTVSGTPATPCHFSFPRYNDPWYANAVGQWGGICISASGHAEVQCARLKGARCAFAVVDTLGEAQAAQLLLKQTAVENAAVGLRVSGGRVVADNCLFAGHTDNAALVEGGACRFYSCTFAAKSSYHGALVALQGYRQHDTLPAPLNAYFGSCIVYGSNAEELSLRPHKGAGDPMQLRLE